jgi:hypothetical protein
MPQAIKILVVGTLDFSIPFGRDNNLHPLLLSLSHNGVGMVSPVCQEILRVYVFDEF